MYDIIMWKPHITITLRLLMLSAIIYWTFFSIFRYYYFIIAMTPAILSGLFIEHY